MVAVTDLPDLQGLADSASAHVNGQLLLLPQNPGLKKWFGIPVPFSSRLFEVKGHDCQTRAWVQEAGGARGAQAPPVFWTGAPRNGTSTCMRAVK